MFRGIVALLLTQGTGDGRPAKVGASGQVDRSYVGRILRRTLLAPDIVETIVSANEPSGLTLERLVKRMPFVWEGQPEEVGVCGTVRSPQRHSSMVSGVGSIPELGKGTAGGGPPRKRKFRSDIDDVISTRPSSPMSAASRHRG